MTQIAQQSLSTWAPGGRSGDGDTMRLKANRRVMEISTTGKRDYGNGISALQGNGGGTIGSGSSRIYNEGSETRQK